MRKVFFSSVAAVLPFYLLYSACRCLLLTANVGYLERLLDRHSWYRVQDSVAEALGKKVKVFNSNHLKQKDFDQYKSWGWNHSAN